MKGWSCHGEGNRKQTEALPTTELKIWYTVVIRQPEFKVTVSLGGSHVNWVNGNKHKWVMGSTVGMGLPNKLCLSNLG